MNLIQIWDKNNKLIKLSNYGLTGLALIPEAPSYTTETEQIPGLDGVIPIGKQLNPRNLQARFWIQSFDYVDSLVKRDSVYDLLNGKDPFYISELNLPYKRWLVHGLDTWSPERINPITLNLELNLIAYSGRAESIGTTTMASTFNHLEDLPVTYTDYTDIYATKFKVYNPGHEINPRSINDFLKITYKGNSDNLRIKNITTGDVWSYNGTSNLGDTIVLEGIRSTKNGLSIFRQTNKRLITLVHGWNEFEISGAPDAREFAVQANMPRKRINEEDKKNPITFEFVMKF